MDRNLFWDFRPILDFFYFLQSILSEVKKPSAFASDGSYKALSLNEGLMGVIEGDF